MVLLDSNLLIYAVQKDYDNLRLWLQTIDPAYSIISKVEVLVKPLSPLPTHYRQFDYSLEYAQILRLAFVLERHFRA